MVKKVISLLLSLMLVAAVFSPSAVSVYAAGETYIVAGVAGLCGSTWDSNPETSPDNVMEMQADGTYVKVYTAVAVGSGYQLKVSENRADGSQTWYGTADGLNITFNITSVCDVTVTFDPATKEVTVSGEGVEIPTEFAIDSISAVGNGDPEDEAWLNGIAWDPRANHMTEISDNVYEITFTDLAVYDNYEVKFAANDDWLHSWGGTFAGSGVATDAVYYGDNITFAVLNDHSNVTLRLDLTNFDYATKTGAKFTITITDETGKTPITSIAATVQAPVLGQAPDYNPVFTAAPADSIVLGEVHWNKCDISSFTGTDQDTWEKMEDGEVFEEGYYYSVDFYLSAASGYEVTGATTGTVNGMPHDDTYGGVYDGIDNDGVTYAYLSGLFEPMTAIELPITLVVKLTGDEKPGKETFRFEIYDLFREEDKFLILNDTLTVENLEFADGYAYIDGALKVQAAINDEIFDFTRGFHVRMAAGSTEGWTYAPEQWRVSLCLNDAYDVDNIDVRQIVDGQISEEPANGMRFTVSYQAAAKPDPINPGTGAGSMMGLWIALLVSGTGLATVYSRKKQHSARKFS